MLTTERIHIHEHKHLDDFVMTVSHVAMRNGVNCRVIVCGVRTNESDKTANMVRWALGFLHLVVMLFFFCFFSLTSWQHLESCEQKNIPC